MSIDLQIKRLSEERGKALKELHDMVGAAGKENRSLTSEETAKYDKVYADVAKANGEIERLKALQAESRAVIGREDIEPETRSVESNVDKEKEAFRAWLAGEATAEHRSLMKFRGASELELRAVAKSSTVVGDQLFGGVVIPVKDYSGVLQAGATVTTTENGNPLPFTRITDTSNTGALVSEANTIPSNVDPSLENVTLNAYKYTSNVIILSRELLRDSQFNAQSEIFNLAAIRIGRLLNTHLTTGDNSDKPNGLITAASTGKSCASTSAFTRPELIDFVHSVDPAYRNRSTAKLMMHDNILAAAFKLVDSDGRPLFEYHNGVPTILGWQVQANNDMASAQSAGAKIMAFGDFSQYRVRRVATPIVKVLNELYAVTDQVGVVVIEHFDGDLLDTTAVKLLANATS